MPALRPVASDEQLTDGIASVMRDEKFVQPLNCRYEVGVAGSVWPECVTELTTIAYGYDDGQLWCCAASSAAEAITVVPWSYAYFIASYPKRDLLSVPSASWTMSTPLSVAYSVASANRLTSAMNDVPTRSGSIMQFGQAPSSPPLFASPPESMISPLPCPYWTSSNGSLSSSRKSQPAMSSA